MYDLERFVQAQASDYERALHELQAGRKKTHWIWYIFPQLAILGFSQNSKFYGMEDAEEARAYMNHPILGPRYLACVDAVIRHAGSSPQLIMGTAVDSNKLKSSLTLMEAAGGGRKVSQALDVLFEGQRCSDTLGHLG